MKRPWNACIQLTRAPPLHGSASARRLATMPRSNMLRLAAAFTLVWMGGTRCTRAKRLGLPPQFSAEVVSTAHLIPAVRLPACGGRCACVSLLCSPASRRTTAAGPLALQKCWCILIGQADEVRSISLLECTLGCRPYSYTAAGAKSSKSHEQGARRAVNSHTSVSPASRRPKPLASAERHFSSQLRLCCLPSPRKTSRAQTVLVCVVRWWRRPSRSGHTIQA